MLRSDGGARRWRDIRSVRRSAVLPRPWSKRSTCSQERKNDAPGGNSSDDPVQEPYAVSVAWLRGEVWWKRSTVLRQRTASGARGGSGWSLA